MTARVGYNLNEYLIEMRGLMRHNRKAASSLQNPDEVLIKKLNQAWLEIAETLDTHENENNDVALARGTGSYPIPEDALGFKIIDVAVLSSAGVRQSPLIKRTARYMRQTYDLASSTPIGGPSDWAIDPSNPRRINVRPIPNHSISNGVIFNYVYEPAPIHKIWRPGELGTAITLSSISGITATASGTIDLDFVGPGTDFGIIPKVNTDQKAITDAAPAVYYRVLSAATTIITLVDTYDGDGISGTTNFVVAEVPILEQRFPGRFRFAPVYLAVADLIDGDSKGRDDKLRARAATILAKELPDEMINTKVTPARPGKSTNMLQR